MFSLSAVWEPHMAPAQAMERGELVGWAEHHLGVSMPSHSIAVLILGLRPHDFYKKIYYF